MTTATRQRLIQMAAWLVATLLAVLLVSPLRALDGSSGLSLFDARVGTFFALLLVLLVGVPVLVLALCASVTGNRLAGPIIASAALLIAAWRGGSIDGWLFRHALPDDFLSLIGEMILWQAGLLVVLGTIRLLRAPIRNHFPGLALNRHVGLEWAGHDLRQSLAALAVCCIISAGLLGLMIRSAETPQVCISLFLAFGTAALVTQFTFPRTDSIVVMLSPAVVAIAGYAMMLMRFDTQDQLLQAWFGSGPALFSGVPAMGLALPIHYASAGTLGCAIGIAWAQSLEAVRANEVAEE